MSISAMSYVWQNSIQEGGAMLVLLALADYANESWQAYPSVSTLANKSRLSERQTQYVLKKLVADGDISIAVGQGPKGCNLYLINRGAAHCTGAKTAGVQSEALGGAVCGIKGVQPIAPNPSREPSKNRHVPPSIEQVKERAVEIGLPELEAENFWNHHEIRDWKAGKKPLIKWKMALAIWKNNWKKWGGKVAPKEEPTLRYDEYLT